MKSTFAYPLSIALQSLYPAGPAERRVAARIWRAITRLQTVLPANPWVNWRRWLRRFCRTAN